MSHHRSVLTLEEFRIQELRGLPKATGELSNLLRDIALAGKRINLEVNKAGLMDIFGLTGVTNIHGEAVQHLDEFANRELISVLKRGVSCAGVASEELEDYLAFDDVRSNQSKYVCVFDPLDGSSNIDVNISIGTIFGIYKRISPKGNICQIRDFLQKGKYLIAAGYIIYGSSTMLVFATSRGVNGFTLNPTIGEFTLTHPNIQSPGRGLYYSVNYAEFSKFEKKIQDCICFFENKMAANRQQHAQRYVGSMVADVHRNLLKGGIYLYPASADRPQGKLRLVYECNPLAFIIQMAGGCATSGYQQILEIQPLSLHQRTPIFIGSKDMILDIDRLLS